MHHCLPTRASVSMPPFLEGSAHASQQYIAYRYSFSTLSVLTITQKPIRHRRPPSYGTHALSRKASYLVSTGTTSWNREPPSSALLILADKLCLPHTTLRAPIVSPKSEGEGSRTLTFPPSYLGRKVEASMNAPYAFPPTSRGSVTCKHMRPPSPPRGFRKGFHAHPSTSRGTRTLPLTHTNFHPLHLREFRKHFHTHFPNSGGTRTLLQSYNKVLHLLTHIPQPLNIRMVCLRFTYTQNVLPATLESLTNASTYTCMRPPPPTSRGSTDAS